jgi:hypothetical protein
VNEIKSVLVQKKKQIPYNKRLSKQNIKFNLKKKVYEKTKGNLIIRLNNQITGLQF